MAFVTLQTAIYPWRGMIIALRQEHRVPTQIFTLITEALSQPGLTVCLVPQATSALPPACRLCVCATPSNCTTAAWVAHLNHTLVLQSRWFSASSPQHWSPAIPLGVVLQSQLKPCHENSKNTFSASDRENRFSLTHTPQWSIWTDPWHIQVLHVKASDKTHWIPCSPSSKSRLVLYLICSLVCPSPQAKLTPFLHRF